MTQMFTPPPYSNVNGIYRQDDKHTEISFAEYDGNARHIVRDIMRQILDGMIHQLFLLSRLDKIPMIFSCSSRKRLKDFLSGATTSTKNIINA